MDETVQTRASRGFNAELINVDRSRSFYKLSQFAGLIIFYATIGRLPNTVHRYARYDDALPRRRRGDITERAGVFRINARNG